MKSSLPRLKSGSIICLDLLNNYQLDDKKIKVIQGGDDRNHSIMNIIESIEQHKN